MSDDNQSKFNTAMLQSVERMRNEALNLVVRKEATIAVLQDQLTAAAQKTAALEAKVAELEGAKPAGKSKGNGKGAHTNA